MKTKLLFVVNVDWFFLSHRLPIAREALRLGYEVHIATAITDRLQELRAHGLIVHPVPLSRSGTRVLGEWRSFWHIARIFRQVRPDIAHLVTVKPIVFGGLAARLVRTPALVAAVSGLGFLFLARGWRAAVTRWLVLALYRVVLGHRNLRVVFQNEHDQALVQRAAALPTFKSMLIPGSGVDLKAFREHAFPAAPVVVVLAARLLIDKGVREFVQAARQLRADGVQAHFWLVGSPDDGNRASVTQEDLLKWQAEQVVEVLGHRGDMPAVLAQAHIVALPSYREGFPKVLIEAAACGRPVVTTDVPGCRDAMVPGQTGLLVPARDAPALAAALRRLIEDAALRSAMGRAGRALAERRFGIEAVVQAHMQVYAQLLAAA
jgi:glycosyltransferase involved in cell wall biosynthesis